MTDWMSEYMEAATAAPAPSPEAPQGDDEPGFVEEWYDRSLERWKQGWKTMGGALTERQAVGPADIPTRAFNLIEGAAGVASSGIGALLEMGAESQERRGVGSNYGITGIDMENPENIPLDALISLGRVASGEPIGDLAMRGERYLQDEFGFTPVGARLTTEGAMNLAPFLHPAVRRLARGPQPRGAGIQSSILDQQRIAALGNEALARDAIPRVPGPPQPYPPLPTMMGVEPWDVKVGRPARGQVTPMGTLPGLTQAAPAPVTFPAPASPMPGAAVGRGVTGPGVGSGLSAGRIPGMGGAPDVPVPPAPHQVMGGPIRPTGATGPTGGTVGSLLPEGTIPPPENPAAFRVQGGVIGSPGLRRNRGQRGASINPAGALADSYEGLRQAWERTAERGMDLLADTPVGDTARRWFLTDERLISPEYELATDQFAGGKRLGSLRGEENARVVNRAVKEIGTLKEDQVYRHIGGEANSLTPNERAKVQLVKDRIRDSAAERVALGDLSVNALNEYAGGFLRRVYEAHDAGRAMKREGGVPKLGANITRMDSPGIILNLPEDVVAKAARGLDPTYEPKQIGNRTLVKFSNDAQGARALEILKKRLGVKKKDIHWEFDALPDEIRDLLGEVRNPAEAVRLTIEYNERRAETAKHFRRLRDGADAKGAWSVEHPEGVPVPEPAYMETRPTQIIDGTEYTYMDDRRLGDLHRRWVRSDIVDSVMTQAKLNSADTISAVKQGYRRWLAAWKANRTVLNPSTHALNVLSLPHMSVQAGVSMLNPDNARHYRNALNILSEADPYNPEFADLVRRRVVDVSLPQEEIAAIRQSAMQDRSLGGRAVVHGMETIGSGGLSLLGPIYEGALAKGGRLYAAYDNLIRLALELKLREKGLSPQERMTEINRYTPNYARQGKLVSGLRSSPVGSPFATFAYEQKRILLNNLLRNPARAVATLSLTKATQEAVEALISDATDEEKDAIQETLGGWGPFRREMTGWRDDKGRVRTLQLGALDPNDEMLSGPQRGIVSENPSLSSDMMNNAMYGLRLAGLQTNPFVETAVSAARGQTSSGRRLPGIGDKAIYLAEQMAHPLTPFAGSKAKKVQAAIEGERAHSYAPEQTVSEALLDALLHVTLGQYDPKQTKKNLTRQKRGRDASIKSVYEDDPKGRREALRESRQDFIEKKRRGVVFPPR
jgi:hypothetical protein